MARRRVEPDIRTALDVPEPKYGGSFSSPNHSFQVQVLPKLLQGQLQLQRRDQRLREEREAPEATRAVAPRGRDLSETASLTQAFFESGERRGESCSSLTRREANKDT